MYINGVIFKWMRALANMFAIIFGLVVNVYCSLRLTTPNAAIIYRNQLEQIRKCFG